jgi:hypothetical protein
LLLLEHPSVYTAGRRTDDSERPTDGTPVIDVDRGGRITWHGPGQLVGYPIVIAEFGHKEKLTVVEAKLTTGSESIDLFVVDGSKDESLKATAFVIPARPLRKGAEYSVLVRTARATGATELRTWSFTTK